MMRAVDAKSREGEYAAACCMYLRHQSCGQASAHTLHFVKPGQNFLCHSFRTVVHWAMTCLRQDVHVHMSIGGSQINEELAQRIVQGRPRILQGSHLSEEFSRQVLLVQCILDIFPTCSPHSTIIGHDWKFSCFTKCSGLGPGSPVKVLHGCSSAA